MSSSSVKTIGGAGFRCDSIKGSTEKQGKLNTTAVVCCEPVYCAGRVPYMKVPDVGTGYLNRSDTIGGPEWLDD